MLTLLMIVVAFQHIECSAHGLLVGKWTNVTIPSKYFSPEIIKWSLNADKKSVRVCLPLQTKWIQTRQRINPIKGKRKATEDEFQRIWKHIRGNLMKKIGSKYEDIFTITVMETVRDVDTKKITFFLSAFFHVGEIKKSELDLRCSDEVGSKLCAYHVNRPPSCFTSINPKMRVDKSYSIPISLAEEFKSDKTLTATFFKELPGCSC